jgi:hypothetical protein
MEDKGLRVPILLWRDQVTDNSVLEKVEVMHVERGKRLTRDDVSLI